MARSYLLIILTTAICTGCMQSDEDKIKSLISANSNLYDPSSVLIRNITPHLNTYCFELNAKNKFGAYTGFQKTYIDYSDGEFYMLRKSDIPDAGKHGVDNAVKAIDAVAVCLND